MRPTVIGSTLLAIGAKVIFGSFFLSFLQFRKSINAAQDSARQEQSGSRDE